MTRPILFLDLDSVLNNHYTTERINGMYGIDPGNVRHLQTVLNAVPDLAIVISSTWRLHFTQTQLLQFLREAGLKCNDDLIINQTEHILPKRMSSYTRRSEEIQKWLNEHEHDRFAIVDDDSDARIYGHFVRTNAVTGMLASHAQELIELLT